MANVCELTGKRKLKGNRVSHANNKTIHYQQPNMQQKTFFIAELKRNIRLRVSASSLRSVVKAGGISRYLVKAKPEVLSERLQKLRKTIINKGLLGA